MYGERLTSPRTTASTTTRLPSATRNAASATTARRGIGSNKSILSSSSSSSYGSINNNTNRSNYNLNEVDPLMASIASINSAASGSAAAAGGGGGKGGVAGQLGIGSSSPAAFLRESLYSSHISQSANGGSGGPSTARLLATRKSFNNNNEQQQQQEDRKSFRVSSATTARGGAGGGSLSNSFRQNRFSGPGSTTTSSTAAASGKSWRRSPKRRQDEQQEQRDEESSPTKNNNNNNSNNNNNKSFSIPLPSHSASQQNYQQQQLSQRQQQQQQQRRLSGGSQQSTSSINTTNTEQQQLSTTLDLFGTTNALPAENNNSNNYSDSILLRFTTTGNNNNKNNNSSTLPLPRRNLHFRSGVGVVGGNNDQQQQQQSASTPRFTMYGASENNSNYLDLLTEEERQEVEKEEKERKGAGGVLLQQLLETKRKKQEAENLERQKQNIPPLLSTASSSLVVGSGSSSSGAGERGEGKQEQREEEQKGRPTTAGNNYISTLFTGQSVQSSSVLHAAANDKNFGINALPPSARRPMTSSRPTTTREERLAAAAQIAQLQHHRNTHGAAANVNNEEGGDDFNASMNGSLRSPRFASQQNPFDTSAGSILSGPDSPRGARPQSARVSELFQGLKSTESAQVISSPTSSSGHHAARHHGVPLAAARQRPGSARNANQQQQQQENNTQQNQQPQTREQQQINQIMFPDSAAAISSSSSSNLSKNPFAIVRPPQHQQGGKNRPATSGTSRTSTLPQFPGFNDNNNSSTTTGDTSSSSSNNNRQSGGNNNNVRFSQSEQEEQREQQNNRRSTGSGGGGIEETGGRSSSSRNRGGSAGGGGGGGSKNSSPLSHAHFASGGGILRLNEPQQLNHNNLSKMHELPTKPSTAPANSAARNRQPRQDTSTLAPSVSAASAASMSAANNQVVKGEIPQFGQRQSPAEALQQHEQKLTRYERLEILEYDDIYYVGERVHQNKIQAPIDGGINFGYDDDRGEYNTVKGDHVAYRYEVQGELGRGSFGQVLKVFDHKRQQLCALKLIRNKKRFLHQAQIEIKVLDHLRTADVEEKSCTVRMLNYFQFRNHVVVTFELHALNLYELTKLNKHCAFPMQLIRRFAAQLLVCLSFLSREKILHADLKPENILLRAENKTGIRVIDFGSSCFIGDASYQYIQSRFYRAPEVVLHIPYSTPMDAWSMGCIMAEMQLGYPLFPGENEKEQIQCFMEVLGLPPQKLLDRAPRKKDFFDPTTNAPKITPNSRGKIRKPSTKTLKQLLNTSDDLFVDFVAGFLRWDPNDRMTPQEGMEHPFIKDLFTKANQRENAPSGTSVLVTASASASTFPGGK